MELQQRSRANVLLAIAILGFVVPNAFVIACLVEHGLALGD